MPVMKIGVGLDARLALPFGQLRAAVPARPLRGEGMLNEKPPDDGHRKNILSSSFTHIGIAVFRDSSGTVWLTQDFSN
jgi:Cysteine-rich secretory protein family